MALPTMFPPVSFEMLATSEPPIEMAIALTFIVASEPIVPLELAIEKSASPTVVMFPDAPKSITALPPMLPPSLEIAVSR